MRAISISDFLSVTIYIFLFIHCGSVNGSQSQRLIAKSPPDLTRVCHHGVGSRQFADSGAEWTGPVCPRPCAVEYSWCVCVLRRWVCVNQNTRLQSSHVCTAVHVQCSVLKRPVLRWLIGTNHVVIAERSIGSSPIVCILRLSSRHSLEPPYPDH